MIESSPKQTAETSGKSIRRIIYVFIHSHLTSKEVCASVGNTDMNTPISSQEHTFRGEDEPGQGGTMACTSEKKLYSVGRDQRVCGNILGWAELCWGWRNSDASVWFWRRWRVWKQRAEPVQSHAAVVSEDPRQATCMRLESRIWEWETSGKCEPGQVLKGWLFPASRSLECGG